MTSGRPRQEGAKRLEILAAATERFGRDGYEDTRWADVAGDVGIGPTALYHYFESKQHCLYEVMDLAIEDFRRRFSQQTTGREDPLDALVAVLVDCFDLSDHEVLRNRLLVAEQNLLALRRTSVREEEARQAARSHMRDLELAWAGFLTAAMRQDALPRTDPRLLTRAILGLLNSVWIWYRPNGDIALRRVGDFFVRRTLAMAGVLGEVERRVLLGVA